MGNRLSKIYTRTGDDGTTGLGDGTRVPKDAARVEAYGTVDEANSAIGMVLAVPGLPPAVASCLIAVQHDLFDLGGELCIPGMQLITAAQIDRLEHVFQVVCRLAHAHENHLAYSLQPTRQHHLGDDLGAAELAQ